MAARPVSSLPRPAFGSSPNLQALVLEAGERSESAGREGPLPHTAFYEVTIASADQPKLLSRLSAALVRTPLELAHALVPLPCSLATMLPGTHMATWALPIRVKVADK